MLDSDSVKFNKQVFMQIQLALQFRHSVNNKIDMGKIHLHNRWISKCLTERGVTYFLFIGGKEDCRTELIS